MIEDVLAVAGALIPRGVEWSDDEVTRKLVEASLPAWTDGDLGSHDVRRAMTSPVWSAEDVVLGNPLRNRTRSLVVKIALVVSDLRYGRLERVRPWEGRAVAGVLGLPLPAFSDPAGTDAGTGARAARDTLVEFVFPWRPTPARTRQRLGTSTSHVRLCATDPVDAPVCCSLWTPEGRLEVRLLETQWLRPVLCPGSWRPIPVSEFMEAVRSGTAWRDNPFLPHTGRCCPTFDLGDYAEPRVLAKGDGLRLEAGREACLGRAGALFDVAGTVHRAVEKPLAGIGTVFRNGVKVTGPLWAMGYLNSSCDMNTLGHVEEPCAVWCEGMALPEHDDEIWRGEGLLTLSDWIGLLQAGDVGTAGRTRMPGPWPESVRDLVQVTEPPAAPDVMACLHVAKSCADRLSSTIPGRSPGRADARGALSGMLSSLPPVLASGVDHHLATSALTELRTLGLEVLSHARASDAPEDGMWAYVASLGVHLAACELAMREHNVDWADLHL